MSEREGERGREGEGRGREGRRVDSQNQFSGFHLENITCFARCLWVPLGTCHPVIPRCIPIPKGKGGAPYDAATDTPIGEFDPVTFGDLGLSDTEALIHSNIRLMSAFVSRIYRAYFFLFSLLNL